MLNVKYITYNQPLPLPDTQVAFKDDQGNYVIENTDVLPKAFFVDSVATATLPKEIARQMKPGNGFNPSHTALVQTHKSITSQTDSTAQVQVTTYNAAAIKLQTQTQKPGFMVLSEIYYPAGWTATIDGEPTDIYKTNFVLRGIQVPAGKHQIVFRFEPDSIYYGHLLAWIGHALLLCLGIGTLVIIYRKNN